MNPYIGITDFTNFEQVQKMSRVFDANLPKRSARKLHVGVMMSYRTLHGMPSKWQSAFPPKDRIANIFSSYEVYNCLHYADYDYDPDLWKSLAKAISYGGIGINAVQLDMIWPDPGAVANGVHTSRKQIEVILQIGKDALDQANNNPQIVADRLENYQGVIHRVLLDRSIGRGIGLDANFLIPFAQAIKERFPALGIGVAGGLGPDTIQLVEPLVAIFPDLSIDAQGRLRSSGNALFPIDWDMAESYLVKAQKLFA